MTKIEEYLSGNVNSPFFLIVGDKDYSKVRAELSEKGIQFIKLSNFCKDDEPDKRPNLDELYSMIATIDVDAREDRFAVLGLGEYLALCGEQKALSVLKGLSEIKIGNAKIILLLRGVSEVVQKIQKADPNRFDSRRVYFMDDVSTELKITFISNEIKVKSPLTGISGLLKEIERENKLNYDVRSAIMFDSPLISTIHINSAYQGVRNMVPSFPLAESCGSKDQWASFLSQLDETGGMIDAILKKLPDDIGPIFDEIISEARYENWKFFIALKMGCGQLSNSYLKYVLEITNSFSEFKKNIINTIINISHTDERFDVFYIERKRLIEKIPNKEIEETFVVMNRINPEESIYKLTDTTKAERREIIAHFSSAKKVDLGVLLECVKKIYPALYDYLKKYNFSCGETSDILTDYFDAYKWQKIRNIVEEDFAKQVEGHSKPPRIYNRLPTRNEIIMTIDRADTRLYWLDALGVEYLGFIQAQCQKKNLSIKVYVAQAELPTLTCFNKDFYDDWIGERTPKNPKLDEIKHKDEGGYDYQNDKLPTYLASELEIIEEALDDISTVLALRQSKKFLLVSDHGASRLCVIKEQEEKYETDTKGEHGGRCCKVPKEALELPFATEERGYLVLANHGRFKGSRAANVEVHGGATLEEALIPIIEITLANQEIKIEPVDRIITASYKKKATINLFSVSTLKDVSVVINGKRYAAVKIGTNHYMVETDITRANEYPMDILEGDNIIGKCVITVQSESGKKNDSFDDIF